jgi:hypothetical protein
MTPLMSQVDLGTDEFVRRREIRRIVIARALGA